MTPGAQTAPAVGRTLHPSALFGRLLDDGAEEVVVRATDGDVWSMPMGRWLAPASPVDHRVLARAVGPVLDVGCGPGRHVHALTGQGVVAVGVELSPAAVRHARDRGARVVEGSIFEVAPTPGRWATALLLDGNIGIGGRPEVLLRRIAGLLRPDGTLIVELDAHAAPDSRGPVRIRIETAGATSAWFPWARVTDETIDAPATAAGLRVADRWFDGDRRFCVLVRS